MVCVYCDSPTQVKNSRLQKRGNHIWRRRRCLVCSGLFTTEEHVELGSAFLVQDRSGGLTPFSRDRLFITIYESCKHRPGAAEDAAYLTQVIISTTLSRQKNGVINRHELVATTIKALERFDRAAATIYAAYHPL